MEPPSSNWNKDINKRKKYGSKNQGFNGFKKGITTQIFSELHDLVPSH